MSPVSAAMTWLLDGATFDKTERPNEDAWIHHFTTPSGPIAVAWSRSRTQQAHAFPGATEAFDVMGARIRNPARVRLTEWPTYVRF